MFDIPDKKVFMDSVHGYIAVPKCFVQNIIDTNAFQRLRNIDQTGMRMLYPNGKHDRFSHSLGVFHLGCKAVDAILENFSQEDYWNISSNNERVIFWAKNKVLFLIACLLHDIGHAPFSHALEQIILDNSTENDFFFSKQLVKKFKENENWGEHVESIPGAPHEQIGAMFIIENMGKAIEAVFDDLIEVKYPLHNAEEILYAEHYRDESVIDKTDLQRDIYFIARMILGFKYEGYEPEKQIRNCFIELLNGSNFDVDKLDYVLRDTQMSGISNTGVDVERLVNSVCIVTKTKYVNTEFKDDDFSDCIVSELVGIDEEKGLGIIGNFRGSIILQNNAYVEMMQGSTFLYLCTETNGSKIKCDGNNEIGFNSKTEIIQNGKKAKVIDSGKEENICILSTEDGERFTCEIKNAILEAEKFRFTVCGDQNAKVRIEINGSCNIKIKGKFKIDTALTCFKETKFSGFVKTNVILGNKIRNIMPCANIYNEFSVGFKKQAINVIANVLEARDYLYLWIYVHHKVVYYANFLIPVVLPTVLNEFGMKIKSIEEEMTRKKINPFDKMIGLIQIWPLNYKNIKYLDDSYLWTVLKFSYFNRLNENEEINHLCEEILSRKYKVSLYKSLAEFDILFEAFTDDEREKIQAFIENHLHEAKPRIMEAGNTMAGYFDDEIINKIKVKGQLTNITSIVYVRASYKAKKMNVNETFIEINKGKVVSIGEIPLLSNQISKTKMTDYYFYLYYSTKLKDINERKHETEILKNVIIEYFKDICKECL